MKKLIKNGFIVDGSGNPGYKADVLLNGGIIEKIAETIEEDGAEIINAEGLVVAPGFIDTHSHSIIAEALSQITVQIHIIHSLFLLTFTVYLPLEPYVVLTVLFYLTLIFFSIFILIIFIFMAN